MPIDFAAFDRECSRSIASSNATFPGPKSVALSFKISFNFNRGCMSASRLESTAPKVRSTITLAHVTLDRTRVQAKTSPESGGVFGDEHSVGITFDFDFEATSCGLIKLKIDTAQDPQATGGNLRRTDTNPKLFQNRERILAKRLRGVVLAKSRASTFTCVSAKTVQRIVCFNMQKCYQAIFASASSWRFCRSIRLRQVNHFPDTPTHCPDHRKNNQQAGP